MKCNHCGNEFDANEIDLDGFCYVCANPEEYAGELAEAIAANLKELVENTILGLSAAKGVSPDQLKAELVAEHVLNQPEKYIKSAVEQVVLKKKNAPAKNN